MTWKNTWEFSNELRIKRGFL